MHMLARWIRLSLAAGLLIWLQACNTDGLTPGPVVEAPFIQLNLDGDNLDAPLLAGGTYEAGVRFVPGALADAEGGLIRTVQFYLTERPNTCAVRLYKGTNTDGQPDELLYNAVVSSEISAGRWNEHALSEDITVSDDDLWVVIRFSTNNAQQSLGCDPGPAVNNGDWLYSGQDDQWRTLRDRSGNGVNINWNIRAVVEP